MQPADNHNFPSPSILHARGALRRRFARISQYFLSISLLPIHNTKTFSLGIIVASLKNGCNCRGGKIIERRRRPSWESEAPIKQVVVKYTACVLLTPQIVANIVNNNNKYNQVGDQTSVIICADLKG